MKLPLPVRVIAARAGISHPCVVRWSNGTKRLSPETEARVCAVIEAEQRRIATEQTALALGRAMQMKLQEVS